MFTSKFGPQKRKTRFAAVAVLWCSLSLAGAGAETLPPQPAEVSGPNALETSAGRYEFTPTTCGIFVQDGEYDIEVRGPGTAPDGEKIFFELSSTANAMSIGLGVETPYASPERLIQAGRVVSQEFDLIVSGEKISATDLILVNEDGASVGDGGSLSIDCSVQ